MLDNLRDSKVSVDSSKFARWRAHRGDPRDVGAAPPPPLVSLGKRPVSAVNYQGQDEAGLQDEAGSQDEAEPDEP